MSNFHFSASGYAIRIIIFLFYSASIYSTAECKTTHRELIGLIKKYDIKDSISSAANTSDFWRIIRDNSNSYKKALKIAKSGKARNIQRKMGEAIAQAKENYVEEEYPYQLVSLLDSLRSHSGIAGLYPNESKLYLDPSEYANAYTLPDGSVYITYGMIKLMDFNHNLLMAVYAHEISHFILQHSFLHLYKATRRTLHKRIAAELFSVITIGFSKYADLKFDELGITTTLSRNALDLTRATRREISRKTIVDKMYYGREQEFEADIIAYRFIEYYGISPDSYIEMLNRLNSDLEIFSRDESEHPLTADRIALINLLRSNPDLKIKVLATDDDIYGY